MPANDTPPPASAEIVNGIAREVHALRVTVRKIADLPARVAQLEATLARAIEDLSATPRRVDPVRPVSWIAEASPDSEAEMVRRLRELADWVGAIYMRYPVAARELPDCWLWHPDMVEELAWLQQAWQAAYDPETGSVAAAGDWHDRHRPGVAARIRAANRNSCSLECHVGDERVASRFEAPSFASVDAIASWWTSHRDELPPLPTPTDFDEANIRMRGRRR